MWRERERREIHARDSSRFQVGRLFIRIKDIQRILSRYFQADIRKVFIEFSNLVKSGKENHKQTDRTDGETDGWTNRTDRLLHSRVIRTTLRKNEYRPARNRDRPATNRDRPATNRYSML